MVAIFVYLRITEPRIKHLVHDKGIANALLDLYQKKGTDLLQYLTGPYSLAVVLKSDKKALLAIDRMGMSSLCFHFTDNQLIFADNCAAIAASKQQSASIDQQALFNYMYFHVVPTPGSTYKSYTRLSPGCYVELTGNEITHGQHWQAKFEREQDKMTLSLLRDEFYTIIRGSVQQESQINPVGTFLSGGIDSSTITGILKEFSNEPVRTYSIGFEESEHDEMEYARIVAKHFGCRHHEYSITPKDVIEVIPKIAKSYGEPYGNLSAVSTYYCAAMAKADGIKKSL